LGSTSHGRSLAIETSNVEADERYKPDFHYKPDL